MHNGNNDPTEVDQVVFHVEYKTTIYNVSLIDNQKTGVVIYKTLDRRLELPKPAEKGTIYLSSYIWKEPNKNVTYITFNSRLEIR